MDFRFKTNLMEHLIRVNAWVRQRGAKAHVDVATYMLDLQLGEQRMSFFPQFVVRPAPGVTNYMPMPEEKTPAFVGWLPYRPEPWGISVSKIAFKKLADELGLPVPALWERVEDVNAPYLVKLERSSFGQGMRGPYKAEAARNLRLKPGEFCEEFKFGRIARAWYWDGRLCVLEAFEMPTLTGDGKSTYDELLRAGAPDMAYHEVQPLAALQGVQLTDVPAMGQKIVCDYRYISPFNPTIYGNANMLRRPQRDAVVQRFEEAGRLIAPHLPLPQGQGSVGFVLDAIIDAEGQPWFLEINSNPQGHPDSYPVMLDRVFNVSDDKTAPARPQAHTKQSREAVGGDWDYFVGLATQEHKAEVEAVRRSAYERSKEFEWNDFATLAWGPADDDGTVLAVWDRNGTMRSTLRVTVLGGHAEAEAFMEYSLHGVALPLPFGTFTRAATVPGEGGQGLFALIRHAFMRALVHTPVRAMVAQIYAGGSRVESMQKNGYVMHHPTLSWDSEAKAITQPILAVLGHEHFERTMEAARRDFGPGVRSPYLDVDAIAQDLMRQCRRL